MIKHTTYPCMCVLSHLFPSYEVEVQYLLEFSSDGMEYDNQGYITRGTKDRVVRWHMLTLNGDVMVYMIIKDILLESLRIEW